MSYEYHQLLKYVYFEGYADSYEEADYLLEQLSDEEFDELCENVSGGRSTRASSRGTPEAAKEEFVIDYLVTEGYTNNYDSAIAIYESMSDEWLDTILEVRGGGRVSFTGDTRNRGMAINPSDKTYRKKIRIEMDMEDEEDKIRARNRAEPEHRDSGPHPEEEGDDTRSRRSKRKAARRDAAANREIETSPRMQRLQQRHQRLSDVHDRLRYGR